MKYYSPYREDLTLEQARPAQTKSILPIYTNKVFLNGYKTKDSNKRSHTNRNLTLSLLLVTIAFYVCYVV